MRAWREILALTEPAARAFAAGLRDPLAAQAAQLKGILNAAQDTRWGRQYALSEIESIADYQARVPISDYEAIAGDMSAVARGEAHCRFPGRPCFMETTGGSTGGVKWIPWTEASLAALQRGLLPWLHDLLRARPGIPRGRSYWAISPPRRSVDNATVVPTGMGNDARYFGDALAARLGQVMLVPAGEDWQADLPRWRRATLLALLASEDLSFVSVWSPTFLTDLLDFLDREQAAILDALARAGHRRRAAQLAAILARGEADLAAVWPRLDTVSCWTEGSARHYLPSLAARLPGVHIQGKGLLATEGMVTLPLEAAAYPVLAIHSGFYEFLDEAGIPHLCDDLQPGQCYEVIITTWAGLYRYRLGDRVRMQGYFEATPMLSFEGRAGLVSDLCGEKLGEDFVARVMAQVMQVTDGGAGGFAMLLPLAHRRCYLLVVDAVERDEAGAQAMAAACDTALRANPQYALARDLGQLGAIEAARVTRAWQRYRDFMLARGMLLGDIKPPLLGTQAGLAAALGVRDGPEAVPA